MVVTVSGQISVEREESRVKYNGGDTRSNHLRYFSEARNGEIKRELEGNYSSPKYLLTK